MNILFTCGGTAGHINPAVALARTFQRHHPDCNILFVGADGGMETRLIPEEGYECRTVTVQHLDHRKTFSALKKNLKVLAGLNLARKQANAILDEFKPDLVVGTGGYASFPVVRAAARRHIPTAIHESNALPGITTKALAGMVDLVMLGFEAALPHYQNAKRAEVTGTPVRPDFFRYTREEARSLLGMHDDRPLLLSFFGSLGATVMNGLMTDVILSEYRAGTPYRHIHGAGRDFESITAHLTEEGISLDDSGLEVRQYIYDMPLVMAAADLVICRAGAATLSELAAISKPAILIPSPNVAADHQTKNASVLSDAGGAVLLPERECSETPALLHSLISDLMNDNARRQSMSEALATLAVPDSAEHIYQLLFPFIQTPI